MDKYIEKRLKYLYHLMTDDFSIVRLLGWYEDAEDTYWVVQRKTIGIGNEIILYSTCGWWGYSLKKLMKKKKYKALEQTWSLNESSIEDGLKLAKEKNIEIK